MISKCTFAVALMIGLANSCVAQEKPKSSPAELEILKASIGVWDAEIEVWSSGPDSASLKFKGVETNRAFGEYWVASDFVSEFMGQTVKVHSIVGYDLDKKKLVGTVVDHGPYAASMTGDYDVKSKSVTWMTKAKYPNGNVMIQKTIITQNNANERVLVLTVPKANKKNEFTKFMKIRFVKRK